MRDLKLYNRLKQREYRAKKRAAAGITTSPHRGRPLGSYSGEARSTSTV